jgi:hypothetical protein
VIPGKGQTFDGRDVFAPAAAALWRGAALGDLGKRFDPRGLVTLERPVRVVTGDRIESEVLWVDGFGNVQLSVTGTDIEEAGLAGPVEVTVGSADHTVRQVRAFSEVGPDELGLILDSNGNLALVGNRSRADRTLGLNAGDRVTLGGRATKGGPGTR